MSWKQGLQSSLSMESGDVVAQTVKCLSTMWETRVRALGWEDPWRRKWQSTQGLPGKSHGQRSLVGYSPWGCKESGTTEWLHFHFHFQSTIHQWESLEQSSSGPRNKQLNWCNYHSIYAQNKIDLLKIHGVFIYLFTRFNLSKKILSKILSL